MLKAIFFDLDDTLLDWSGFTEEWEDLEMRHLEGVFHYICEQHPLDGMKMLYAGEVRRRTKAAWFEARENHRSPHLGQLLLDSAVSLGVPVDKLDIYRCMEAYAWGAIEGTELFPEVIDILTLLRSHGLKMGIVTNAYQPMLLRDIELKAFGLSEFFPDCRIAAADVGYLKPHPEIFQKALSQMGVAPSEAVFVGDDVDADIVGAKQARIFAVLRHSVGRTRMRRLHSEVEPDAQLTSLEELPRILDDAFPGWR
jgi:putative hydrolase of the HAD superfamily